MPKPKLIKFLGEWNRNLEREKKNIKIIYKNMLGKRHNLNRKGNKTLKFKKKKIDYNSIKTL